MPGHNNGTKWGSLAVNSRIAKYIDLLPWYNEGERIIYLPKNRFVYAMNHILPSAYASYFFDKATGTNSPYKKRYYQHSDEVLRNKVNDYLQAIDCPFMFTKQLRCGIASIFENIMKGVKVKIICFSIFEEERESYYIREGLEGILKVNEVGHSSKEEYSIIKWLHSKDYIDATYSMLSDRYKPTLEYDDLIKPNRDSMEKIINLYGYCDVVKRIQTTIK